MGLASRRLGQGVQVDSRSRILPVKIIQNSCSAEKRSSTQQLIQIDGQGGARSHQERLKVAVASLGATEARKYD